MLINACTAPPTMHTYTHMHIYKIQMSERPEVIRKKNTEEYDPIPALFLTVATSHMWLKL